MNKVTLEIDDCRKCHYNQVSWCWYTGQPRYNDCEDPEERVLPIPDWCPLLNNNEQSKHNA